MACLEPEEIAYTISFTVAVTDKRKSESPLNYKILENIESNKIEVDTEDSRHHGYYCYGVPQIIEDIDQKSIYFEAEVSTSERGSYRSGGYLEPDEYPDLVLDDIDIVGISAFDGKIEKNIEKAEDFGNYPDFTYTDFINLLEEIVEDTTSPIDDSETSRKTIQSFPSSIIEKVEKYVKTSEFIDSVIKSMEVISPSDLDNAISVFNLDMEKYRGKIAGIKFGL
jgi:hypothetical protein